MDPESLLVILPCWALALSIELAIGAFLVNMTKDKTKRFK
jgi:hypothetical protein